MSTVLEFDADDEQCEHGYQKRIHCKGAAEFILDVCDFYLDVNGNKLPLDDNKRGEVKTIIS